MRSGNANIHASCVALGRQGVLLLGESGSGKSDLALRLIEDGACLVADDRTELFARQGRLCARAPRSIAGLMEVRGLGIVAMPFDASAVLRLAVRLDAPVERLPEPGFYDPPEGLGRTESLPLIVLDGHAASAPARIRLALKALAQGLIQSRTDPPSKRRK